jgi:hypothetical protein
MAAGGEPDEITALRTNLNLITDTVTVGDNLQWFANSLVEKAFITQRAAEGILGTSGVAPDRLAGKLMDSVFAVIRASDRKRHWFDQFVDVFSNDAAYAELAKRLKSCASNPESLPSVPYNALQSAASPPQVAHSVSPSAVHGAAIDSEQPIPPSQTTSSALALLPARSLVPSAANQPATASFWGLEKVKATIQQLKKMFANLHAGAVIEISEQEANDKVVLESFRSYLLLLPVRQDSLHVKFFDKNEDDIVEARNTRKIMAILCRYVDYRNYEVFFHVVTGFCGTPLQERMNVYCIELEQFETKTTVDVYIDAVPHEASEDLVNGFSEMAVKIDKPESQCTLLEIRNLNKAIIKKATLCSHSVYIGAVSSNCVLVKLRFPSSAIGWVLGAITPDLMTQHHLTEVSLDGRELTVVQGSQTELNEKLYAASEAGDVMGVASLLNSGADIETRGGPFSSGLSHSSGPCQPSWPSPSGSSPDIKRS